MIPVFEAEKLIDGLVDRIQANRSIAYTVPIIKWDSEDREKVLSVNHLKYDSRADVQDVDLFFTKSILVSTNWNKNDDVFDKYEVWAAKHTPSHKPTNVGHDENKLVGHITDVWALDTDSNIIPFDTTVDDLPDLYHLANGAVIYRAFKDDDLKERAETLISEVLEGKKYVSMECLFSNFSYAVLTPENEFHILERNKTTAHLTQHLRYYGGKGEFDGCKIGRVPRNIVFSGKGYVDNPANEFSVIFDQADCLSLDFNSVSNKNPFISVNGVSISCKRNSKERDQIMANEEVLKEKNDDLKAQVVALTAKIDEMTAQANEMGIKALKDEVTDLTAKLKTVEQEKTSVAEKLSETEAKLAQVNSEFDTVVASEKALKDQVAKAEQEKLVANRVAKLVDGGIEKDTATAKVELFANLNDDQFNTVADELIEAAKMKKEFVPFGKDKDKDKDKDDKKDSKADVADDEEVLDTATADTKSEVVVPAQPEKNNDLRNEIKRALASKLRFANTQHSETDEE